MRTSSSSSAAADDRALVRRFLDAHEEAAFRDLYRLHTPRVYRLALRLTRGNSTAAEDIVQEMWMRAVPRLGGFDWQSSLGTWLCAVAINIHREHLRRHAGDEARVAKARRRLTVVGGGAHSASVDLERAIAELPDGYREVLVLHDVEGYTHREIGILLDVDEGTSKSQLSKARRAMRAWLERKGVSLHARGTR